MGRNTTTSAIVDGILIGLSAGTVLGVALVAPGAVGVIDKLTRGVYNGVDKRSREREYQRVIGHMRRIGLLELDTKLYEHGLVITKAGKKRALHAYVDSLEVPSPEVWDKHWRMVMFDIPETQKAQRNIFIRKLRELGFQPLQRSVWVHPYPCRKEIEQLAMHYSLATYVTYMKTSYIDSSDRLEQRFARLLSK